MSDIDTLRIEASKTLSESNIPFNTELAWALMLIAINILKSKGTSDATIVVVVKNMLN